jgi:hypothetical protein
MGATGATYSLTGDQYEGLLAYFELSLTAISDDEFGDLLISEKPIRDMLLELQPRV